MSEADSTMLRYSPLRKEVNACPKTPSLSAFAQEVNPRNTEINLARAALTLAAFEYPDLDVQAY